MWCVKNNRPACGMALGPSHSTEIIQGLFDQIPYNTHMEDPVRDYWEIIWDLSD